MGIDPAALESMIQARRLQHRTALDLLRARLAAAEGRVPLLRAEQARLSAHLAQLDGEGQLLLQELTQLNEESDRPHRELMERHRRAEADMQERIAGLQRELERWIDLERRVAEGVMQAVQPYLEVNAAHPYQERVAAAREVNPDG